MIPCPPRERIQEFLEEHLGEPDSQELEQHVEGCSSCQQVMADLCGPRLPSLDTIRHIPPPSPNPDAAPPQVPGCELTGEVKFGGMGAVYFGCDTALHRPLAVKVLRRHLAAKPELVARFEAEAQVCAQLQHPGIVPVHQVG